MSRLHRAIELAAKSKEHARPLSGADVRVEVLPSPPMAEHDRSRLLQVSPLPVGNPFLAGLSGCNEMAGEEYRKLRSMVVKLTRGEAFHNTLLITSAISGEGKTLTALNLALSLAQAYEHTVLLVDADLRKPSVHRYLGLKPEIGLVQCLKENIPLSQALIKTGLGKLVVLPAGGIIDDPVELLASDRMKEIIRELKSRYPDRYIIFDAPPVLPVADAQVLAQEVDGVLFVVREDGPKLEDVAEALKSLDGARLLGAVYNNTECFGKRDHYYGYR